MIELSAPIQFYLKHQAQIDEWAALAKEVPKLAHELYSSLAPALEERAASLEGAPLLHQRLDRSCSALFLFREGWRSDATPRAAIGLEWLRSSSGFRGSYSGVWIHQELPRGRELHALVKARIAATANQHGLQAERTWWAAWRYESPARDDFWNDLDGFARDLVEAIATWWTVFHRDVDAALAELDYSAPEP